jgi:hypothetical protein
MGGFINCGGGFPPQPIVYTDNMTLLDRVLLIEKKLREYTGEDNKTEEEIEELRKQIAEIEKTLENFGNVEVKKIVEKYLATMIFVEISDAGYIIYNIPERWDEIIFNTQGVDVDIAGTEYGRLILSY